MANFSVGDWIAPEDAVGKLTNCRIAKIKTLYDEENTGFADLVMYAGDGTKLGRVSEPFDGPKTFEPFCELDGWVPIEKPKFPLTRAGWGSELFLKGGAQ